MAVEKIDAWLNCNLKSFDLFGSGTGDSVLFRRKSFDELCLYLFVSDQLGQPLVPDAITEHVTAQIVTSDFSELVRRHPRDLLLYSFPILLAQAKGLLSSQLRKSVEYALGSSVLWSVERPPNRVLDLWHFCTSFGWSCRIDAVDVLNNSNFCRTIDPIISNLEDAYAFTHNAMFSRNFGAPWNHSVTDEAAPLNFDLLCMRYLGEKNFDVGLEICLANLICEDRLPCGGSLTIKDALSELFACGYVPSPLSTAVKRLELSGAELQWAENYHTMLVAGILFRVLLSQESLVSFAEDMELRALATAYSCAARYDLHFAAEIVRLFRDTQHKISQAFIGPIEDYLRSQVDTRGRYGILVDERISHMHIGAAYDFDEVVHREVSSCVASALR